MGTRATPPQSTERSPPLRCRCARSPGVFKRMNLVRNTSALRSSSGFTDQPKPGTSMCSTSVSAHQEVVGLAFVDGAAQQVLRKAVEIETTHQRVTCNEGPPTLVARDHSNNRMALRSCHARVRIHSNVDVRSVAQQQW